MLGAGRGAAMATSRTGKGWSELDLIRAAGYRKADKGLRRLRRIEDGSDPLPDERRLRPFALFRPPDFPW